MIRIKCNICEGTNVVVDAYAKWDYTKQEFELVDTGYEGYCEDCCDTCKIIWEKYGNIFSPGRMEEIYNMDLVRMIAEDDVTVKPSDDGQKLIVSRNPEGKS